MFQCLLSATQKCTRKTNSIKNAKLKSCKMGESNGLSRIHSIAFYKPILFVKKLMNNYAIHISTQSFDAFWNCLRNLLILFGIAFYKSSLFVKKLMNNYAIHISTQSFDAFWNCILFPCDTKIGSGLDLDASMVYYNQW